MTKPHPLQKASFSPQKTGMPASASTPAQSPIPPNMQTQIIHQEAHLKYSSPLPPSEELNRLREIDPSIPERLMVMVEKEQQNRFENDKRNFELQKEDSSRADEELQINKRNTLLSTVFSFLLVLIFFVLLGVLIGVYHQFLPAGIFGAGGLVAIVYILNHENKVKKS